MATRATKPMTTESAPPTNSGSVSGSSAQRAEGTAERTLSDAHVALQWQIATRADDVLTALQSGRWPGPELNGLVDYLVHELLDQATVEDRLLYYWEPATDDGGRTARLGNDHLRLRATVDALARIATGSRPAPGELAATVRSLLDQLESHLQAEETAWSDFDQGGRDRVAHALQARSHHWFALTEGDVIDLDALPDVEAVPAALERLSRLRCGEQVEIHYGRDLQPLWRQLRRREPDGYGWGYLQEGPDRWRAQITRREEQL